MSLGALHGSRHDCLQRQASCPSSSFLLGSVILSAQTWCSLNSLWDAAEEVLNRGHRTYETEDVLANLVPDTAWAQDSRKESLQEALAW